MEYVSVEVQKFKTEDGRLFDNVESAKRWEEELKKKKLADKFPQCSYKIQGSHLFEQMLNLRGDVDWYLIHPLTQEDIDSINAYVSIVDMNEDHYGIHSRPEKFEIEHDYIMIESLYDMYIWSIDGISTCFKDMVDDELDYILNVQVDNERISIYDRREKLKLLEKLLGLKQTEEACDGSKDTDN